jgi:hypothetical protein
MASHYLFDAEFCNPASGWEKGQVEKNVQDARHRLWVPTPSFANLAALNTWLEQRCIALWSEIPHGILPGSVADAWVEERSRLMTPARSFDGFIEHTKRVSPTCLVHLERNRYNVVEYAAQSIGWAQATELFGATFFGEGMNPSGVIEMEKSLNPDGLKVLKEELKKFRGAGGEKTFFLDKGMKWTPVSRAPNEAQFIETRQHQIEEVCRWFGVPPHILETGNDSFRFKASAKATKRERTKQ